MAKEDNRLSSERAFGQMIADNAEKFWHWQGCAGNIRWHRRAALIFERIRQSASETVLEVGSGTGILTQELMRRLTNCTTYVSSDISLALLNKAKKKKYETQKKPFFLINNAYCNGIRDNSIDAVVGISVLHHLDLPEALREFHRILKADGIGVFTEPNYINPHVFLERRVACLRKRLRVSEYETAFVRWKLRNEVKQAGFKGIDIYPFDFVYPLLKSKSLVAMLCFLGGLLERVSGVKEFAGSLFITFHK